MFDGHKSCLFLRKHTLCDRFLIMYNDYRNQNSVKAFWRAFLVVLFNGTAERCLMADFFLPVQQRAQGKMEQIRVTRARQLLLEETDAAERLKASALLQQKYNAVQQSD